MLPAECAEPAGRLLLPHWLAAALETAGASERDHDSAVGLVAHCALALWALRATAGVSEASRSLAAQFLFRHGHMDDLFLTAITQMVVEDDGERRGAPPTQGDDWLLSALDLDSLAIVAAPG